MLQSLCEDVPSPSYERAMIGGCWRLTPISVAKDSSFAHAPEQESMSAMPASSAAVVVTVLPGNLGAVLASEAGAASMLPDEILAAGVLAKASDPTSQENLGTVLASEACAAAMSPDEILVAGVVAKPSVTVLPENLGAVLATESDAASMLTPLQTSDKTQNTEADVAENVVAPSTPVGAGTAAMYFASPGATPPRTAVTPQSKASVSLLVISSPIKELEAEDEAGLVRLPPHRMKTKGQRAAPPMNVKILLPQSALLMWNSHHSGGGHDCGCPFLKYF